MENSHNAAESKIRIIPTLIISAIIALIFSHLSPIIPALILLGVISIFFGIRAEKLPASSPLLKKILVYLSVGVALGLPFSIKNDAELRQKTLAENESKSSLSTAEKLLEEKRYTEAIAYLQSREYPGTAYSVWSHYLIEDANILLSNDAALKKVMSLSQAEFDILTSQKNLPIIKNIKLNDDINAVLRSVADKKKAAFLAAKKRAEKEGARAANENKKTEQLIEKFGEEPIQSSWDGSYSAVKTALEEQANDPESIKIISCTKPRIDSSRGWVVRCDYRGKNSFGAVVKNSNWFVIKLGSVVGVLPASTY